MTNRSRALTIDVEHTGNVTFLKLWIVASDNSSYFVVIRHTCQ